MSKPRDGRVTLQPGQKAPMFALRDAAGNEYSLADELRKGPVVVAFFKISCPVCQFTFPFLERLHKAYGNSAATFLAVSQDDALDTREFCTEYGITFPALVDGQPYAISNLYGLTNVPSVFLIAPDATVNAASIGFDKANLEKISTELAAATRRPRCSVLAKWCPRSNQVEGRKTRFRANLPKSRVRKREDGKAQKGKFSTRHRQGNSGHSLMGHKDAALR